jgi:hypothetical protein
MDEPGVDIYLRSRFCASTYCKKKGIELAAEEAGLDTFELGNGPYIPIPEIIPLMGSERK